ncbi:hypothetical protein D3C80_1184130 [compost metagenome]
MHFGLRQSHRRARFSVIKFKKGVALPDVLPVAEMHLRDHPFRAGAKFNGMDRLDAARDLAFSGVIRLVNGGDAHRNGCSNSGLQGAGKESAGRGDAQKSRFH